MATRPGYKNMTTLSVNIMIKYTHHVITVVLIALQRRLFINIYTFCQFIDCVLSFATQCAQSCRWTYKYFLTMLFSFYLGSSWNRWLELIVVNKSDEMVYIGNMACVGAGFIVSHQLNITILFQIHTHIGGDKLYNSNSKRSVYAITI